MKVIDGGGVTASGGFKAAGVACGIKASGKADLALLASDPMGTAAGLFTSNKVAAAPVQVSRQRLGAEVAGLVINSGNANACTGSQGLLDALEMTRLTASQLRAASEAVLVASTGIIGEPLPMDKIEEGIALGAQRLSTGGGADAARAIMTTDRFPKELAVTMEIDGRPVNIGAMAKGAGMIGPQLIPHATMIAVITTDAALAREQLQASLNAAAARSFNAISVDGDTSTNDSVFLLANGASGVAVDGTSLGAWQQALDFVCLELAKLIVRDGEGATKLITYHVSGAPSDAEAAAVGRVVANSLLIKTAFFGGDPNWGRILAAVGRAGVAVDPAAIDVAIGGVPVARAGQGVPLTPTVAEAMKAPEIDVAINLNCGDGHATFYGCDLGYDYVKLNAEYHT